MIQQYYHYISFLSENHTALLYYYKGIAIFIHTNFQVNSAYVN